MSKMKTAAQIVDEQWAQGGMPPRTSVPTTTGGLDAIETFLTEYAGGGGATFFKFAKGSFVTRDGTTIPCGTEYIVPYTAALVGWIRFNGEGNKPTRHMGKLFDGFLPPLRNTLGDTDMTQWEQGLDGKPADPWQMQMLLPLIDAKTNERFVFNTTSATGRNAVGKLIAACKVMRRKDADIYPIVRLDVGSFRHRDSRVGTVSVPVFPIVGQAPKDGATVPDTSIAADLDDAIPF
jgi:hypothetical protein